VAADALDFILFFACHEVRGRPGVVFSMFFCFAIWGKKGGVEYRVDRPLVGEGEFEGHRGYHLRDGKGAMSPGCKLY